MPVSAEGRVEHQKLNQVAALLSPGCVFGVQLDYSCRLKSVPSDGEIRVVRKISCRNPDCADGILTRIVLCNGERSAERDLYSDFLQIQIAS